MALLYFRYILATPMRIPTKVSLGVGALALLVFGGIAAWQADLERRDLVRAVQEEMMLTGRAMRVASQNALRDRQVHDVDATVSALEEIRADVDVLLFAPDGGLLAASDGAIATAAQFDVATLSALASDRPHVDLGADRAVLVVPLVADGAPLGSLAIVRPLTDIRADLRREVGSLALAVLGFTALVAALAYGLGEVLVGRPLARLSAAMTRVGGGDFQPVLPAGRDDEIGQVTHDFLQMLAQLERARTTLEAEQDAHRRSTRALQDADRLVTIGQLSAGLAHEIGSPLQVLHGRARRLLRHLDDPAEIERSAELIAGQAERITRIVQRLLDIARRRSRIVHGDPRDALRSVVDLLEVEARRKRVALELIVADEVGVEPVDSDAFQQIALNLTRNALQAAAEGGRVVVSLAHGTLVRPGAPTPVASLRLVVDDDGVGIPAEQRAQLFEPFFTTRAGEGGTGLGLAIVGTLVKDLEGTVSVASELSRGSRFTVDLPRSDRSRSSEDADVA